jgi:hypothetical protein
MKGTTMDSAVLTDLSLVAIGAVYYLVYRFVIAKQFKLKMIHSIWIPLLYAIGFTIRIVILLQTPWFGANRTFLSQAWAITEVNLPVLSYLVLFGLFALVEKKPAQ